MPVETFRTCIKRLLAPKPFFALCCAGVAIITGVSAWRLDDPVVVAALGGIALLVVALQAGVCWNLMQLHYASLEEVKVCRRETEALFSTFRFLEIRAPFPPMMGYACYPDYANVIIREILRRKPQVVVELGSGVSTLVSAYCLEKQGTGRTISLDHEEEFASVTRQHLAMHGLDDVATVRNAPIVDVDLNGAKWRWYDPAQLADVQAIDLPIVDGPPASVRRTIESSTGGAGCALSRAPGSHGTMDLLSFSSVSTKRWGRSSTPPRWR